jgi:hypothetical protein
MSDELLKEIAETASLNPQNYYLKFVLEGFKESVVYVVTKEESDRVEKCFFNHREADSGMGLEFEDLAGRYVNLRPDHVILFHALWDVGLRQSQEPPERDLVLYISGFDKPQEYDDVDPEELFELASTVQGGGIGKFVGFTDEDGERVYVRGDKIILMESVQYSAPIEE